MHLGFSAALAVGPAPSIARQAHLKDAAERGRQMVRPTRFDVRRISLRAAAPAVSGFQGLAFLRGGMIAAAPRAAPLMVCKQTTRGGCDAGDLLFRRDLVEQLG